jgi:hypothetical protein
VVKIRPATKSNRILRNKPPHLRIVIPKRIVVQPRLVIEILPLKPRVLLNVIDRQLLNRAPSLVCRLPDNLPLSVPIWSVWK